MKTFLFIEDSGSLEIRRIELGFRGKNKEYFSCLLVDYPYSSPVEDVFVTKWRSRPPYSSLERKLS